MCTGVVIGSVGPRRWNVRLDLNNVIVPISLSTMIVIDNHAGVPVVSK